MMDSFLSGLSQIFEPATLIYMALGSLAGIIAAAIPGFTVTMAIVLTLPLTFAMEPLQGHPNRCLMILPLCLGTLRLVF